MEKEGIPAVCFVSMSDNFPAEQVKNEPDSTTNLKYQGNGWQPLQDIFP
jgi:hypothetical protein